MAKVVFGSPGLGSASIDFDDDQLLADFLVDVHAAFQSDRRGCWVYFGSAPAADGEQPTTPGYGVQWVPASTPIRFVFDRDLAEDSDLRMNLGML
ncbi:hypothetical protein [Nocardioides sp. REDSEA-S30_B4]|jgi:hypothetical protein|uniref:hypothetical protein n=1 Tax=Nocardioides sp. REDSEA-S30_B4 TaxID=1811552 RepID=UPI000A5E6B3D|nr:hypothetical protein [Nocardioides sp. REDSEA-S30_B4]